MSTRGNPPAETMSISRFKATCLAVLERIRQTGQPLVVTKRGEPVAQILPPPPPEPKGESTFGCMRGKIEILGDVVSPVATDEWDVLR